MKRRNLANLHIPSIENEIEMVLFGGESGLEMELYTKVQPLVKEIAELVVTHTDAGMRDAFRGIKYDISSEMRDKVYGMVQGYFESIEKVEKPVEVKKDAFDELLMLDI